MNTKQIGFAGVLNILYIILVICITFACKSKNKIEEEIPPEPNVVFILVDDLGIKDLSFSGSTYYETQNIDQLANKGIIFTQGYANSAVCSPSRASIFTGKFTARHGITDWIGAKSGTNWRERKRYDKMLPANYNHKISSNEITLAEVMKSNGYKTFFAGKWHLGGEGSLPEDNGFDINKGGWDKGSPTGGYFSPFRNPKLQDEFDGENLSTRLANETLSFIEENKTSKFFAFLSFYAVHGPIETTQEKWKKYQKKVDTSDIKKNGFKMERKLPIRQTQDNPIYAGLVESMDDAVGVLLEGLKKLKLDKNTIIIFTSDNGGVSSGDSFSTSNLPYRGGKGYQWEGGSRVPYVLYVPWLNTNGKKCDYPVTGTDFFPTILDYSNINLIPKQHKDGISLRPVMEESNHELPQRSLYWHYPHYGNQGGDPSSIIRKGDWKLIYYYENNKYELYNLSEDPSEQNDLSSYNLDILKPLKKELQTWLLEVGAKYPTIDDEYVQDKQDNYKKEITDRLWPKLEKNRRKMLSKEFKPNKDWWGSNVIKE